MHVTPDALARHRDAHLPKKMQAATEKRERRYYVDVKRDLYLLEQVALGPLTDARLADDRDEIERWSKELRRTVNVAAKVQGEVSDGTTVNVLLNPTFQATVQTILAEVPDREARIRLAQRLMLESSNE